MFASSSGLFSGVCNERMFSGTLFRAELLDNSFLSKVWQELFRLASAGLKPMFSVLDNFGGMSVIVSGVFDDVSIAPALVIVFCFVFTRAAISILPFSSAIF